jgi:polysaccharide export outer membrane protein
MFRMPEGTDTVKLRRAVNRAEQQYRIRPDDFLEVRVYTNKGERILDPNGELMFGAPGSSTTGGAGGGASRIVNSGTGTSGGGAAQSAPGANEFLVQRSGQVKLPMVDMVLLGGLTLYQADSVLQIQYSKYYKDVFVATRVTNNRVIVLGSMGGRVVPLYNENMNLLEVLASVGGLSGNMGGSVAGLEGRSTNVRLIRGDLKNPQVEVINLHTIEGLRRANLQIEPNDIIYVEPVRRPFVEAFRDYGPVLTTALSLVTTTILILTTVNR